MATTTMTRTTADLLDALVEHVEHTRTLAAAGLADPSTAAALLAVIEGEVGTMTDQLVARLGAHDGAEGVGDHLHRLLVELVPGMRLLAALVEG